ncbi:hypothetical protein KIN20_030993 [Parelaphostrongylus tenuis]|uniref:ATP-dependent RNA helicase n=1 Tax=Parelaphostrongylus tenuis TaxID=148309 RepID=A0AAD5WGW9_PARTN|nr:hypothetical protein KIN20_030993 [Parelaphostrongylus tenuis]
MGYHFEPFNSDFFVSLLTLWTFALSTNVALVAKRLHCADNQETIKRLKRGEIQGIVSSNKLVRAVDIPEVDHIIFYDMVENFNDYKHRIGRTGTMGRGGRATVMLSMNADRNLIIPLVEVVILLFNTNSCLPLIRNSE